MANRFPLVLDTTDNNKIKEIQTGDNLNLADNSIVGVQNITALGTINAADIRVAGNRLVAQSFADLTDTPSSFIGAPNYFVKVKADGTGLEYRPLSDLGNIEIDTITVDTSIIPSVHLEGSVGTLAARFDQIVATSLYGNLRAFNGEIVFNATSGKISYGALQGAPTDLSEFTNEAQYLLKSELDAQLAGLFDEGQQFVTDIQGSVFGDDSTLLVDGVNSIITGDVLNSEVITTDIIASTAQITTATVNTINGPATGDLAIDAGASGIINIGVGASTAAVNIENAVIETFDQGSGLGAAQITADTDLTIAAGNRVRIDGGVPFKFATVTSATQLAIGAQEGDVIYNTTTSRLQMFQGGAWKDVNGNVEATTGTSNFNDVVVAGNLTVTGTTTSIETTNTDITDNVITLNKGEVGVGVTLITSGIEIERGSAANRSLVWTENFGGKWIVTDDATFLANQIEANYIVGNLSVSTDDLVMTDGNITATGTLTMGGNGVVQIVSVTTNIELLPVGKVFVDGNLEVTGNTTVAGSVEAAAFKGTFVGDDSTILVDGVSGTIPAENLSGTATISVIGNVTGALTGNADTVTNGVYTAGDQTIGGAKTFTSNILANLTGNVAGNIDNTGLTIGATTATTIGIGNAGSTTTINGIVNLPALIAGEITADNSISITTAVGDGNAISIGPGGTNRYVNLTADYIRFYGPVTNTINATGGIVGDIKGSVVADDSTVMIDGVGGKVVGDIDTARLRTSEEKIALGENAGLTTQGIAAVAIGSYAGTTTQGHTAVAVGSFAGYNTQGNNAVAVGIGAGQTTQGDDTVAIGGNAGQTTQGANAVAIGSYAGDGNQGTNAIAIGKRAGETNQAANSIVLNATGVAVENTTASSLVIKPIRSAVGTTMLMYDATSGEVTHSSTIAGTFDGDVTGSVFSDDSSIMVDAVGRTLASDLLTLSPLAAEPSNPVAGQLAVADGTGWDPAGGGAGKQQTVIYLGSAWVQIAIEA